MHLAFIRISYNDILVHPRLLRYSKLHGLEVREVVQYTVFNQLRCQPLLRTFYLALSLISLHSHSNSHISTEKIFFISEISVYSNDTGARIH